MLHKLVCTGDFLKFHFFLSQGACFWKAVHILQRNGLQQCCRMLSSLVGLALFNKKYHRVSILMAAIFHSWL